MALALPTRVISAMLGVPYEDRDLFHGFEAAVMSLREMLSNVVRHAKASRAVVTVTLRDQQLTMNVKDNGVGVADAPGRGRGTGNLMSRAHEFDGDFDLVPNPEGGSIATWRAQKVKL